MSGISKKQIAVVHLAKKQLGFDDETYRTILFHHGDGALSANELTPQAFSGVMAYFNAWGFRSSWMQRTYGDRPGMASPHQIDLIRKLWREWSGGNDEAALNLWLEKSYGVSALRFVKPDVAGKTINGLRAMKRRRAVKVAGAR